jgi:hypothetical protein
MLMKSLEKTDATFDSSDEIYTLQSTFWEIYEETVCKFWKAWIN